MKHRLALFAAVALCLGVTAAVSLRAQAPDRSKLPGSGAPPSVKLPAIAKRQLTNGLPVWIVELHEVPVAQVNLVILSGTADDPVGKYGIASMTAAMLDDGAGRRSALEIADAIDFLGADLSTASGIDSAAIRLHVPVARLADALPIMADVAERPTFPKDELERLRTQRLTSLIQSRDDASSLAQLAFSRVLYGTAHRFGTATLGTADTIKSFTPEDLKAFYQATYRPTNAALIVVGDVTPDKALPLLETNFGGWKPAGTAAPRVTLPPTRQPAAREVYLVDKPGAPQSQIRIGTIGVARSTPDYFPITVTNTILGGSFSSRLNMNLREKHGYTYGASSIFDMRKAEGPLYATAGVQTDKTSESLTEFFNELNAIREPVPGEEVGRSKNYIALRFPERFEATGDVASNLETMLVYGLPDDYFSKYVPNIEAVTPATVQATSRKYIQPDKFVVVVVGDRKTIEPGIRALNLGPIKIMTVDEILPAPK